MSLRAGWTDGRPAPGHRSSRLPARCSPRAIRRRSASRRSPTRPTSGSARFYNHFRSKQDLFDAAVEEVLEEHGDMVDAATAGIVDPAEVFAAAMRMTARLPKTQPGDRQDLPTGSASTSWRLRGGSRPGRDGTCRRAEAAGRFTVDDLDVALACASGALLGVLQVASTDDRARRRRPGGGRAGGEPAAYVRRFGRRGHPDRTEPPPAARLAPPHQSRASPVRRRASGERWTPALRSRFLPMATSDQPPPRAAVAVHCRGRPATSHRRAGHPCLAR